MRSETDPLYYVGNCHRSALPMPNKDGNHPAIFKRPVHRHTEAGTSITMGFPVCLVIDFVSAEDVCAYFNKAEPVQPKPGAPTTLDRWIEEQAGSGEHTADMIAARDEIERQRERIDDLLRSNNEFEGRARKAERQAKDAIATLREIEPRWRELEHEARPRPISEYHEDMGAVLWWALETETCEHCRGVGMVDGAKESIDCPECKGERHVPILPHRWAGEPPYVGSPNDLGKEITVRVHVGDNRYDYDYPHTGDGMSSYMIGGWPGYHTHFTPIPMPKEPT